MIDPIRLLGFAFANADLLFEVDRQGKILFATGAASALSLAPDAALTGKRAAELFAPEEARRFETMVQAMDSGARIGPLPVTLANGAAAALSLCYLPQNKDHISCTLIRTGERTPLVTAGVDKQTGLPDREAFLAAAAQAAGGTGAVALVDVAELPKICAKMKPTEAEQFLKRIGDNVKGIGARFSGRLSETGFGIVADNQQAAANLTAGIERAAKDSGAGKLKIDSAQISLNGKGLTHEQAMLSVRYVIGHFTKAPRDGIPSNIGEAFDAMVSETIDRAADFNATVAQGKFRLAFEPILSLKTGAISHYEALSRFEPGQSPGELIKFAEEIGIADSFDIAVAMKVFSVIEDEPNRTFVLALNISGQTLSTPASLGLLLGFLEKKRHLAKRVMIEITESAKMPDLVTADKAIQSMRALGYKVGLDDFGAGSASLQYLHAFTVDFVKIDGSLIQRLGKSQRDDALLRGIAATCNELRIDTIAEWIDSDDKLKRSREIGFSSGQGRYFGGSLDVIPMDPSPMVSGPRPRRMGVQETWQ